MPDLNSPFNVPTEEEMSDIINKYHEHCEYDTRPVYFNLRNIVLMTVEEILDERGKQ